ncbi:hypothetical protein FACS189423_01430 [Bacteroidia bacterium]|nr:hypothetical protein FACS189423_01430 [Bacteroidia bacterium]
MTNISEIEIVNYKINVQQDFSLLFQICEKWDKINRGSKVIIDISGLSFLNPSDILILTQCIIYLLKKRPDISLLIEDKNKRTSTYIDAIGLARFCQPNYKQPQNIEFITSQTAMPILCLERSSLDEYVVLTLRYIGNFCPDKDLTILDLGIKESINNVYDHSQSSIGAFVFCQCFPKTKTIRVCVSDMGIGIPANVRIHTNMNMSDNDCIRWAIKGRNTTMTFPYNVGLGLANIVGFVESTNSRMKILSNRGCLHINGTTKHYQENNIQNFIGTLIEFDIKIDNLEDKREDYIEDNVF